MAPTGSEEWKPTACNLCYANCGILVQTEARRITRVKGDKAHPASRGYTCNKALQIDYYQNAEDRLTSPLRRRPDGSFEEISWDVAISEIALKMATIRDTYGGDKIFRFGGGGQGNHIGGGYFSSVMATLGIRYKSNALAQEKTGYFWMMHRVLGGQVHGELDHAQCLFIVGKNPWQSNGFQRARILLRQASKDKNRTLIVMDPRKSETAELADIHLAVKPGRDAWALSAMIAHILQRNLVPQDWLGAHTTGFDQIRQRFSGIDVDAYARFAGLPPTQLKAAAQAIATAQTSAYYEDLGVQMAPHSTLVSYLNLLLMGLCGHYGRVGTMMPVTSLIDQFLDASDTGEVDENGYQSGWKTSPVAGARIIAGLVPCNVIPEEILTDHPERYRAMFIESSNPCHSMAHSESWRRAIRALDCSVVIDVAMTETARQADYVLPAASQYEKWEATFFNFEYPRNVHHLRAPLFTPLPGTLPEPEIHARLVEALNPFDRGILKPLRAAAKRGYMIYALRLMLFFARHRGLRKYFAYILYRTLGPSLPDGASAGAIYLGIALRFSHKNSRAVRRTGLKGLNTVLGLKLFRGILTGRSGTVFSVSTQEEAFDEIRHDDRRLHLAVGEMLDEVDMLADLNDLVKRTKMFPFLLAAGERRAYTANTIIRDPAWMKSNDATMLAIHPEDARIVGVGAGEQVQITTEAGQATAPVLLDERMQRGTVSLPNGLGLIYTDKQGDETITGTAPNELTSLEHRDKFAGSPFHKHVPARLTPALLS